jgi:hypothetical protein
MPTLPPSGLRILAFTQRGAGPYAMMLLGCSDDEIGELRAVGAI